MRWRHTAVRYGDTPAPATPYQRAEQLWDERIGAARVQAANWRLMAFGCLVLAAVVIGDDIRARSRSAVTPFVVEVDRLGAVQAIAPATPDYQPSDQQVAYFLGRFITEVRGLSIDPVVVRQAWLDAYAQITSHAKPILDEFARDTDPFGKIGKRAVTVDITSVVRASDRSFRIAWIEHPYADGTSLPVENWSAILTVVIQTPRTEALLRQNPLGIYIDAISWARELGAHEPGTGGNP
jgi:type IV secretory pathway TrbF-like protein